MNKQKTLFGLPIVENADIPPLAPSDINLISWEAHLEQVKQHLEKNWQRFVALCEEIADADDWPIKILVSKSILDAMLLYGKWKGVSQVGSVVAGKMTVPASQQCICERDATGHVCKSDAIADGYVFIFTCNNDLYIRHFPDA